MATPDAFVSMKKGEKGPVFGTVTMTSGTFTVGAPTCTLYDSTGAIVAGYNNIAATGFDPGALAAPRVWLNIDTASLPAGWYTLVFSDPGMGSDTMARVKMPVISIHIQPVP